MITSEKGYKNEKKGRGLVCGNIGVLGGIKRRDCTVRNRGMEKFGKWGVYFEGGVFIRSRRRQNVERRGWGEGFWKHFIARELHL